MIWSYAVKLCDRRVTSISTALYNFLLLEDHTSSILPLLLSHLPHHSKLLQIFIPSLPSNPPSYLLSFFLTSFLPSFFYIRQSADHTGAGVSLQTRQCLRNIRCNCSDSSFIRIWRDTPGIWGQLFFLLLLYFILVYFLLFASKLPPLFLN